MILEIAPDYDLFVAILFAWWVICGILNVIYGALQSENPHRDHFGSIEIIKGGVLLLLAAWVVF